MNSIIRDQLHKCKVANIPAFDENTTTLQIPKGAVLPVSKYQVNKCYLVELADYIIHPPETSTLASNWNRGSVPKHKYYKCEIAQLMGKQVKIMGYGYDPATQLDTSDMWEGWVPLDGLKLIQELK